MSGKASVPNVFASAPVAPATSIKTTDWDANWNALVNYANDPTNRISFSTDTGAANAYVLTPSPVVAYSGNFVVWFLAANSNTGTSTANANALGGLSIFKDVGGGPTALSGGEIIKNNWHGLAFDGTLNANAGGWHLLNPNLAALFVPRSYLAGCTLSTAGSSATMSIAAGQTTSDDQTTLMALAQINKTTGGWAVGTGVGGLDTGSIATATWYHFFVIERLDTAVVDVVFSLSATTPTLPANYTKQRRIGSGLTDASSHWTAFVQSGDYFRWSTPPALDVNQTNPGTSAVLRTLTVPSGVVVQAVFNALAIGEAATSSGNTYFSDPAVTDVAASQTATPLSNTGAINTGFSLFSTQTIRTNTSQQIRSRAFDSSTNSALKIATLGWIDRRGQDT